MVADPLLCELGRLFNQGQYTAVHAQAKPLARDLTDPVLQARAESLSHLSAVYDLWDRFCWRTAFGSLQECQKRESKKGIFTNAGWDIARLTIQVEHLERCKEREVQPQRLADLLANAIRRIEQGRFDDAVARLYRLSEYICQVRFRTVFGIERQDNPTRKVDLTVLASKAPRLAENLAGRKRPENGRVDVGLRDAIDALAEADDPVGRAMKGRSDPPTPESRKRGPLGQLLDARNDSLLAHGIAPVHEKIASAMRQEVTAVLEDHVRAEGRDLADLLQAATFVSCPWA
jgi:CRISPR-associated protein (TIGR02710 family)